MSASGRKPDRREAGSRRSKLVAAATVLGAAAIVVTIAALPSAVEPVPPAEPVPVNVTVQRVEPVPELADTFTLTGVVQPRVVVSVSAEVAGRIEAYGTRVQEARWPANALAAGSPIVEGQPVTQGDS
ncbi:MAG: hypothetical protein JXA69_10085, partial [Phycisphaerae bacterium]|nr:hypothetical protein [Phycisphaerae bacterium]